MKIIVGYDRSNVAKDALKLSREHAKVFNGEVYILTSLAQIRELKLEDIQKVEDELEDLKISFKEDRIPCVSHAIVSPLSPGEDLVQFAKENEIDEIIIGVRRRSKLGNLSYFGSNAQNIILNSQYPVVTVN